MSNQGFDKNSGPGTGVSKQIPFGYRPPSQSPSSWFNGFSKKPKGFQTPAVPPFIPSHSPATPGTEFPTKTQVQNLKRTRSPPLLPTYKNVTQNTRTVVASHSISQITKSPPHIYQRQTFSPSSETNRPSTSPSRLSTRTTIHAYPESHVWYPPSADLYKPESLGTNPSDIPISKRSRLPISASAGPMVRANVSSVDDDTESHSISQRTKSPPHVYQRSNRGQGFVPSSEIRRPAISPPGLSTQPKIPADTDRHVWYPPSVDLYKPESVENNPSPTDTPIPKRSRLPFPTSTDQMMRANNNSIDDDTEREVQAKAKRLARFRNELNQPEPSDRDNRNQKGQKAGQLGMEKKRLVGESSDMMGVVRSSNLQPDGEDQDLSTAIIGYCPDMCPEQERAERERKGDLDQYERLDGDRNQTTGSLAVKKYTRTAEREAALIRPMPILQKTMDYLLELLDLPYDDRFLGLYNFLWDRMRAIRMDLRMQHIFDLGAITMLEQMIRLHVIAMHELCQYTKGEGFSEGFDAHLNIEQMNKTSVELFQMYDDHRKKGIKVPTEQEFRGYYALLKLDKHPGYKVEQSELSLDLAKMTPGMRQSAEVLFARNVARACRTGNFIAFFRLVRKASYLQACLMHAHFGKLRTQALASLHSGLQNNQGIPVIQVAKWLGMEEENIEDLLEYHGFSIKEFDEPYMVKERQFLNGDTEYPLKCSKLVHLKRSRTVVDDVLSSPLMESPSVAPEAVQVDIASMEEESPVVRKDAESFIKAADIETTVFRRIPSIKGDVLVQPMFRTPAVDIWSKDNHQVEVASPSARDIFKANISVGSPKFVTTHVLDTRFRNSLEKHGQSNVSATPAQVTPRKAFVETLQDLPMDSSVGDLSARPVFVEDLVREEPENAIHEVANEIDDSIDEEVAEAKLKLILRLWRRRALIKKDLRDKKEMAANAALSSLSLGPPMRHREEHSRRFSNFNIDRAMHDRCKKQEQMWSILNVSSVVAAILGERNQYPLCICWKLLLCSSEKDLDTGAWLRNKLMPVNIINDDLLVSSSSLSIWKKFESRKSTGDWSCYLSVVKNIEPDNISEETVMGASAVMFLASKSFSWDAQKARLLNIISSLPHGSCVPLLIVSDSSECCMDTSILVKKLGLEVDKSRISSLSVIPLVNSDDENLRKGLEWLATESPVQPVLHLVKTLDLISTHVKFSSDARNTTPEHCVSAINEAVDESSKDIINTVKSNPIGWPCPEILLLNEPERKILEPYLPTVGWSSATRINPLIQSLQNCKLPIIQSDISWHCKFSSTRIEIENEKLQLHDFLFSYLNPLLGSSLAQKEASMLVQSCVGLELHGSGYYLVPNWVMIFRRILNWRLTSLSNSSLQMAYVMDGSWQRNGESFEDGLSNLMSLSLPCLDEMIDVSCGVELGYEVPKEVVLDDDAEMEMVVGEDDWVEEGKKNERKEDERSLSRLLEKCNIVQDIIDKKLSVYF